MRTIDQASELLRRKLLPLIYLEEQNSFTSPFKSISIISQFLRRRDSNDYTLLNTSLSVALKIPLPIYSRKAFGFKDNDPVAVRSDEFFKNLIGIIKFSNGFEILNPNLMEISCNPYERKHALLVAEFLIKNKALKHWLADNAVALDKMCAFAACHRPQTIPTKSVSSSASAAGLFAGPEKKPNRLPRKNSTGDLSISTRDDATTTLLAHLTCK